MSLRESRDHCQMADLPHPTRRDFCDLIRWLEREAGEIVQLADGVGPFQADWDGYAMAMAGAAVVTRVFLDHENDCRDPEARFVLAGGTQWFQTSVEKDSRLYQAQWDAEWLENVAGHLVVVAIDKRHPPGFRAAARQISSWLLASAAEARVTDGEAN